MSQRSQSDQFRDDMSTKAIVGFRRLSVGIVVSAGVFLAILFWGQTTSAFQEAHNSISHYYFEDARIFAFDLPDQMAYQGLKVGDIFVGTLTAIAVFLIWFSGFSAREDAALSLAGVGLLGVALVPTAQCQGQVFTLNLHFLSAITFFVPILYVATIVAPQRERFAAWCGSVDDLKTFFRAAGVFMVIIPTILIISSYFNEIDDLIFWVEWTVVLGFCFYWAIKIVEFNQIISQERARQTPGPSPVSNGNKGQE